MAISTDKKRAWYWKVYDAVEGVLQGFFRIVTKVLLGICYYTIFAITAIILKITGKELIPLFSPDAKTYWREKEALDMSLERVKRQG